MLYKKALILLISFLIALPLSAEYLFLADGSIIEGKVIGETRSSVAFRKKEDGKTVHYPRSGIMRVLYTEMSMNRLVVHLHNREVLRVFLVGEDRHSYIFRHELHSSEEFTVKRSEVISISERNPTGLKAEAGYDEILLKWRHSMDRMKAYRIYMKKRGQDDFIIASEVSGRRRTCRLTELEENTRYHLYVTGLDRAGEETAPSSKMTISTFDSRSGDIPPDFEIKMDSDRFMILFTPVLYYPFMELGELTSTGFGAHMSIFAVDVFRKNIILGMETGAIYLPGNESYKAKTWEAGGLNLYTFGIKAGYRFVLDWDKAITPGISVGAAYYTITYDSYSTGEGSTVNKTSSGFDPAVSLSLALDWYFSDRFFAGLSCGYGMFLEKERRFSCFFGGINTGMRF